MHLCTICKCALIPDFAHTYGSNKNCESHRLRSSSVFVLAYTIIRKVCRIDTCNFTDTSASAASCIVVVGMQQFTSITSVRDC